MSCPTCSGRCWSSARWVSALAIIDRGDLSFLGVGLPPTQPSLGTLIRFGNDFLFSGQWWVTVFPGVALVLMVLSINLLGDWLRDALNPRLRYMPLLEVRDLLGRVPDPATAVLRALDHVSFASTRGEILGVVGESGAGKSLTGAADRRAAGRHRAASPAARSGWTANASTICRRNALRRIRGRRIGMIFQDPLTTLNPLYPIGRQLIETMRTHLPLVGTRGARPAIGWLERVGIPAPRQRIDAYPHEFSGGSASAW